MSQRPDAACVHEWVDQPLRYEQRLMTAYVGDDPEPQEVTGTMVYDERCAKCGIESGWPS